MSGPLTPYGRFRIACTIVFVCFLFSATALAQEPKARASLAASGEVWVGQGVTLVVELLAPGYFSGAPAFDLPDPKGLLIVSPGGSPTISSEEVAGTSYTVQRHEFTVFARTAGVHTIPSLEARFRFKRNPLDVAVESVAVNTEGVSFTAQWPSGAEKLGFVICARDLQGVETWTPEPKKAKAGDAFTRTITFTASDVPSMLFPPFPAGQIDGLGIYPKPPEVRDQTERGEMTGRRRDTVIYVCKRPGQFRIPAARLTWWDLDTRQLRTIEFPARTLDVAENLALAVASGGAKDRRYWVHEAKRLGLWTLTAIFAASLILSWRLVGRKVIAFFRPVHLSPLNPVDETGPKCRAPGLRRVQREEK